MIRQLTRKDIEQDPYRIWNEFVAIAFQPYETLDPDQRPVHLAFVYESEVQNGGHLQYFENQRTARLQETVAGLEELGASCHARVLADAGKIYTSGLRSQPQTAEQYIEEALEGEFDKYDHAFHTCEPSLIEHLEAYLKSHQAQFVLIQQDT